MIVIINQNGEDPPIVQQDKHGGHGERGAAWPSIQPGRGAHWAQEASCSGSDRIRAQVKLNIWTQETINIISIEAATAPHCLDSGQHQQKVSWPLSSSLGTAVDISKSRWAGRGGFM